ncbi:hypothetical protein HDU87_001476 [Geranomyces variabilis]|uniref:Uncharacterized protein n=1 Tax=Geranomyces variabilis TaxID=109894 RepID=A0AAD5TDG4_9FUNG|nr:hypothetical protein HDU87_001476 [Geranomyces variabilis]
MVSSKAAAAILLVASAGSAMATIPASGQYIASTDRVTQATLNAITNACDKDCLSSIGIAANTAGTAVNMKGNAQSASCTCTQNTIPYSATAGLSFTGIMFSSGGTAFTGAAMLASGTGGGTGGGSSSTAGSGGGGAGSGATKTSAMMTTISSSTASASPTVDFVVRRRREVFKRADGDTISLNLTPAGATTASTALYVASGPAVGVTAPSSTQKAMYAGAAMVSAGVAAVIAGIVGF